MSVQFLLNFFFPVLANCKMFYFFCIIRQFPALCESFINEEKEEYHCPGTGRSDFKLQNPANLLTYIFHLNLPLKNVLLAVPDPIFLMLW